MAVPILMVCPSGALRRVSRQPVPKTALEYAPLVSGYRAARLFVLVLAAPVTAFPVRRPGLFRAPPAG